MKELLFQLSPRVKCFFLLLFFTLAGLNSLAQTPTGVPQPQDNEPLQLDNPTNIIVYVIIPVLLLLLYFGMKRRKKR